MSKFKNAALIALILIFAVVVAALLKGRGEKVNYKSGKKNKEQKTYVVKNTSYEKIIETDGRMFAFNRFDIYSEVNGILLKTGKPFRAGTYYRKGETILRIDDSIYDNQLKAKRSALLNLLSLLLPDLKYDFPNQYDKWFDYLSKLDASKTLPPLPEISGKREKYYLASKNILQSYYEIKSMEATHAKYTIKAPYDGYLTSALLREGDMARAGQRLGTFINSGLFEMQATVSPVDVSFIKKGMKAKLQAYKSEKIIDGKIVRINPNVSLESQSVYVFIQTRDKSVMDGEFFNVEIKIPGKIKAAKIPKQAFDIEKRITIKRENKFMRIKPEIIDETSLYYYVTGLNDGDEVALESN